jgi:hypothetical protein
MPTPRDQRRHRRSTVKPDRVRALELLDGCGAEGCTEGLMLAHGFTIADVVELGRSGLAQDESRDGADHSRGAAG